MASKRKRTSDNSNNRPSILTDEEENEDPPFSKPWEGSDATLVVENQKLYVHSNMLSFSSPVFKSMFTSGYFKESKTKTIDLKGKKYDDIVTLLKMIYPQFEIDLWLTSISELQVMMSLIEEYLIKSLRKRIEDHTLYIANIKVLNGGYQEVCALDLMLLADMFNFNDTIDQCSRYIGARYYYSDRFNDSTFSFDSDDDEVEESPNMKEFFDVHKLSDKAKLKIMVNIGKKHLEFIEEERELLKSRRKENSLMKNEIYSKKLDDLKIVLNDMPSFIK